jgi:hypothetical protein
VEPLRDIVRSRPLGWPAEAPVVHSAGILGMLRPAATLLDLIDLFRFYKNETGKVAGEAIANYGPEGFDALLGLIGDPSITGYHHTYLVEHTKRAAGDDPVKRARLAEILRHVFENVVGEAKKTVVPKREIGNYLNEEKDDAEDDDIHGEVIERIDEDDHETVDKEELEEPSDKVPEAVGIEDVEQPGDDDRLAAIRVMTAENAIDAHEALAFLTCDLCDLADPLAREMIKSAFDEGLIAEEIVDRGSAWQIYDQGGETYPPNEPWLEQYSECYLQEQSDRERMARTPQVEFPSRASYPDFSLTRNEAPRTPVQPIEPLRSRAAKIGRNDPCWCGSGKKYKKCHLGQDAPG